MVLIITILVVTYVALINGDCVPSITTVSGSQAPTGQICSGQLILNEDFNTFNKTLWEHEITLGGGGNNEFQWYTPNENNSFVEDGKLNLHPTLTIDAIGEDQLRNGHVKLNPCTNSQWEGCDRAAIPPNTIINPIQSARLRTINSFSFRYGRVELVAKLPTGDWLWPAFWLLPTARTYGDWPRSGEIDLLESRGNPNYLDHNNKQIGTEQTSSTLHFGPAWNMNGYHTSTYSRNQPSGNGFNKEYHRFQMEWTDKYLKFSVDDVEFGNVPVGDGFWARGGFSGDNIWASGSKAAPFDQQFHFIVNLAVGGTNYFFPDSGNQNGEKPWKNSSPATAAAQFWNGRKQWLSGWKLNENNGKDASFLIDSVKVWAI